MKLKELLGVINSNSNNCYLVGNKALVNAENKMVTKVAESVNIGDFARMSYKQLEQMPNVQVLNVGVVHGYDSSILKLTLDIEDSSLAMYK